jgi:RNA polymerase sigma-70 factor (ECF subfamily)
MGRVLNQELIEAAKRGDQKALRALVEATQSRLFRFSLVLCGNAARAEDLCQDVYIKMFDNLAKVDQPEAFMSWLFRLTRNLYIDQTRKWSEEPASVEAPETAAPENAEYFAVHEILSRFEPDDRWLLTLVDMEGYSYREAGDLLGVSEDTVRSRLFRLRKEFLEKWRGSETK